MQLCVHNIYYTTTSLTPKYLGRNSIFLLENIVIITKREVLCIGTKGIILMYMYYYVQKMKLRCQKSRQAVVMMTRIFIQCGIGSTWVKVEVIVTENINNPKVIILIHRFVCWYNNNKNNNGQFYSDNFVVHQTIEHMELSSLADVFVCRNQNQTQL